MKKFTLILAGILLCSYGYSQFIRIDLENNTNDICGKFDLFVDGQILNDLGNCLFEFPQLEDGRTYEMEIIAKTSTNPSFEINIFDLVLFSQIIQSLNEGTPQSIYLADLDSDGAISTYDMLNLRAIMLFELNQLPIFHLIKANTEIPEIDKFDIQVDYSTLLFTYEDFESGILEIQILQLGNLDGN